MQRSWLIGGVAAIGIAFAGVAVADPAPTSNDNAVVAQAVVGGDYSYVGLNQGLGHANVYGGDIGGIVPFSDSFSGQVTGGYQRFDVNGGGANDWNVAGGLAWDRSQGRLGVNVGYSSIGVSNASGNVTNYGVFGTYYAGDQFTLGARAGGVTGTANAFGFTGSRTGGYAGGEAIAYATPDIAVRGTVGYVGISGGHQWTAGVHGEALLSEKTPISAWAGYDYASIGNNAFSINGNTFSIGLKYYLGGGGSLRTHQRTGEDDWAVAPLDLTH
jgi:hypothetical protein